MSDEPPDERGADPAGDDDPARDPADRPTATMPGAGERSGSAETRARLGAASLFGRYRLLSRIGTGGFGEVWEAEESDTGRRVAVKFLSHARAGEGAIRERFAREATLAAALNDPRCVYVFGGLELGGLPAIVMELMPRGTLQDVLRDRGALPPREAVDLVLDVLEGLEAAHRAGILHRDLKPSNCFLGEDGRARLGDFGISRTVEGDARLTATGSFLGTPTYASPEQVRGREIDFRSDFYSLGATLYALLTGRPPFEASQAGEVLARILSEPPAPFGARSPVPRGLQQVVLRLLDKDPARRPPDHASLRSALLPYASGALGPGSLPARVGAYAVDSWLVTGPLLLAAHGSGLLAGAAGPLAALRLRDLSFEAALLAGLLLYFAPIEARWGRTPGKAIFGLRVTRADGGPATLAQTTLRIAVLMAVTNAFSLLWHVWNWSNPSFWPDHHARAGFVAGPSAAALPVLALLFTVLPIVTARRRNGFACLQDLASRTRVMALSSRDRTAVPSVSHAATPAAAGRLFGPFEERGVLWETGAEGLFLARDPVLRRTVWIHRFGREAGVPSPSALAIAAPGRLRWLQGSRGEEGGWDAFEAPGGTSLRHWVAVRGRLQWREARGLLLEIARVLQGAEFHRTAFPSLTLDRVWVDPTGRVRIAHFPVVRDAGGPPGPASWRAFLQQVLFFALEGGLPAEPRPEGPRVPLPEHARRFVARLHDEAVALPALLEELEAVARRPSDVTRALRAAALLPALLLTLLPMLGIVVYGSRFPPATPKEEEFLLALYELEREEPSHLPETREALRVLLAEAAREPGRRRWMRGEREDRLIEMAAAAHPEPTPSQVTEARGRLRFDRRRPEGGAYDAFDRQFTRRYDGSELFEGQGRIEGVSHAAAATAEGYEVELAIPWSGLGGPPAEGRVLGFDVANNDNDGGRRVAQIVWAGTAFDWRDTAAFGDCLLGDSEGNPPAGVTADPTYTIVAPRAGRPLRVDGRLEEADWRLVGRADASVIGRGNNRVAFGLLWDATALYVGVRVEDRELRHDSARAWEDDSVEVFIDGNHASRPPPPWLAGVRAGLMFPAMSGLLAVALATALRGSPVFHALGISIQTASGRRAGRVRCALRTALAWGPLLVMLLPGVPGGASFGFDVNGPGAVAATLAPPALVLLGALFAVLRPQRGLQDLMAGTVLVRK